MNPTWAYLYGEPSFQQQDAISHAWSDGTFRPGHPHSIALTDTSGHKIVFHGDFVVHHGIVTGGTVHGFAAFDHGSKILTATGYSVSFSHLQNLIDHASGISAVYELPLLSFSPTLTQVGSADADSFWGSLTSHNFMFGKAGNDWLAGGAHHDVLNGGKGADHLFGNAGPDTLIGGPGANSFVFLNHANVDTIKDFTPGRDHIDLDYVGFGGMLPLGRLSDLQFHTGMHATSASQHVVYAAATGALYYDSDGVGGSGQVKFAQLTPHLSLHASDFMVDYFN